MIMKEGLLKCPIKRISLQEEKRKIKEKELGPQATSKRST